MKKKSKFDWIGSCIFVALALLVVLLFTSLTSCAKVDPTCSSNELLGTDNQCYSCTIGTPEYASGEFGYCSNFSAGGVACCNTSWSNFNNITCYTNMPWLCSDGLCHTYNTGV